MGLTGNAIFHDDVSDASSDYSNASNSRCSNRGDSVTEVKKLRHDDSNIHVKREITYTAYGENLNNSIKLLSCNKTANFLDQKNDLKMKRIFITSSSTKHEHRQFFGSTKAAIWENIQN